MIDALCAAGNKAGSSTRQIRRRATIDSRFR
jgi:hypothetical protein